MATTGNAITATSERRSLEASLYMPLGGPEGYRLTLYRQVVLRDGDGKVMGAARDDKPIQRTGADIAVQEVTVGGQTYTGAQAMAILAAFFDRFDAEDNPPQQTGE